MFFCNQVNRGRRSPVSTYVDRRGRLESLKQAREPRFKPILILADRPLLKEESIERFCDVVGGIDKKQVDKTVREPVENLEQVLIDCMVEYFRQGDWPGKAYKGFAIQKPLAGRQLNRSIPWGPAFSFLRHRQTIVMSCGTTAGK